MKKVTTLLLTLSIILSAVPISIAGNSKIIVTLKHKNYLTEGVVSLDGVAQADGKQVSSIGISTTPGKHVISVDNVYFMIKGSKNSLDSKSKNVKVKDGKTKNVTFKW